ncbi:unnamed protein product [Rhizophagus irregularis]|nr:unnamed protein product [Rhizophagus irregularis]
MSDVYDELEEIKERHEIEKHDESREEYQVDSSCLKCHSIVEIKMEQVILKRDINDFMGDDMIPEIFIRKKENNNLLKNKHNRNKKTVLKKYEIQRMTSIKELKNFREVRSFMKLCCQYRRFIKEMSKKARPLSRLLKEKTRFVWKEEQRKAFEILKEELKIVIKVEYIRKSYKGKDNNYGINYEEDNENWKNYNVEWEWNENNEWEKNSRDDGDNKLKIRESFNLEEEVIKDINEVIICISEVPNWRENEKVEIPIDIIRYSQRKINPLFQTRRGKLTRDHVNDVIKELIEGKIVYDKDLPIIEIVVKENKIYSMDNRRLYCLKEVFRNNEKICCKYREDNKNFQRKRLQA